MNSTSSSERTPRTRDPAKAREAILDAALVEFGAHGFAGARTAAIAKRAGLSTQLITHHFGSKQGVLDELRQRWKSAMASDSGRPRSFRESLAAHMTSIVTDINWSRLVLWHALERTPGAYQRDDFEGRMGQITRQISKRQHDGELNPDVDPRFIALLSYLIAFAPLSLPDHLRGLTGHDPLSPEYREWAATQLDALLAAHNSDGAVAGLDL